MDRRTLTRSRIARFAAWLGLAFGTFLGASDARGEDVATASTCAEVPFATSAWQELLAVELASDQVRVVGPKPLGPDQTTVSVRPDNCHASASSVTLFFSVRGGRSRARTLHLGDVAIAARPRVLAMAIADLIRTALREHRQLGEPRPAENLSVDLRIRVEAPEPKAPLATPPAPTLPPLKTEQEPTGPPSPPSKRPLSLSLTAETRVFTQGATGLLGARLGLDWPLGRHVALALDLGALTGGAHDPLGEINTVVASFGSSLLFTGGALGLTFGVGPRLELGYASHRGQAASESVTASSARTPLLLASATAMGSFPIVGGLSGVLGLDVGGALYGYGTKADGRAVSTFAGPMVSARVGFQWGFHRRD